MKKIIFLTAVDDTNIKNMGEYSPNCDHNKLYWL